jgi:hypothetical protein
MRTLLAIAALMLCAAAPAPTYCKVVSVSANYNNGSKVGETVVLACPSSDPKKPTFVSTHIADKTKFGSIDPTKHYNAQFVVVP